MLCRLVFGILVLSGIWSLTPASTTLTPESNITLANKSSTTLTPASSTTTALTLPTSAAPCMEADCLRVQRDCQFGCVLLWCRYLCRNMPGKCRLLNSPGQNSPGCETWPPINGDQGKPNLQWIMGKVQCIFVDMTRGNFLPLQNSRTVS